MQHTTVVITITFFLEWRSPRRIMPESQTEQTFPQRVLGPDRYFEPVIDEMIV